MTVSSLSLLHFELLDIFLALTSLFCRVSIYPHCTSLLVCTCFLYFLQRLLFFFPKHCLNVYLVHVCGWWVVSFPFALKVFILLSLLKSVFLGYRIPGWWLFVFQHFTNASPLSSDFLVLEKSALSVAVPLKSTPFSLWALEHFLLALGTRRAA